MRFDDPACDARDEIPVASQRFEHVRREASGNPPLSELAEIRRCAWRTLDNARRTVQCPKAVCFQMPERIMARGSRARWPELVQQLLQLIFNCRKLHRRLLTSPQPAQRQEDKKRLVDRALVPALPDADPVEFFEKLRVAETHHSSPITHHAVPVRGEGQRVLVARYEQALVKDALELGQELQLGGPGSRSQPGRPFARYR